MEKQNQSQLIRRLVVTGMLAAVVVVLMVTGVGIIRIGPVVGITFLSLPVLIGVMAEGLGVGMSLGLAFGVISFAQAFTSPTILAPYFINPLVSVVPRLLIPVVAWLVLRALKVFSRKGQAQRAISRSIASLAGSLTNTVLVLGAVYIICKLGYLAEGINPDTLGAMLLGVVVANGLPEAVALMLVTPAVMAALDRAIYRSKGAS